MAARHQCRMFADDLPSLASENDALRNMAQGLLFRAELAEARFAEAFEEINRLRRRVRILERGGNRGLVS